MNVEPPRAAALAAAVGKTLAQMVSPGQIEHMKVQLPQPMRDLFSPAQAPPGA